MLFHTKTLLLLTCLLLFHAVSFHIPGGFGFFVFRERVSCTCCWSRFSRCVSARASLSSCGKAKEESSDEGKAPGTGNTERMKSASSAIGTAVMKRQVFECLLGVKQRSACSLCSGCGLHIRQHFTQIVFLYTDCARGGEHTLPLWTALS